MPHTPEHGPSVAVSLSDDTRAALASLLEPGEDVDLVAVGVGCTLVLTDRHLLLVRDGAYYRPRSGVQAWALDRGTSLRLTPARRTTSRLVITDGKRSASVFVTIEQQPSIADLVAAVRGRTHADPADPRPSPT